MAGTANAKCEDMQQVRTLEASPAARIFASASSACAASGGSQPDLCCQRGTAPGASGGIDKPATPGAATVMKTARRRAGKASPARCSPSGFAAIADRGWR